MIFLHGGFICPTEIAALWAALPWVLGALPFTAAFFRRLCLRLGRGKS